jgi:uncharacterized protein (TIGR02757 family)
MLLKQKLDYHYKAFDKSSISPDPLQFLHLFKDEKDIEAMGFVASVFAYGNVAQIINVLNKFVQLSSNKPYAFILDFKRQDLKSETLIHRFYSKEDVSDFFVLVSKAYRDYGSLRKLFLSFYNPTEINLKESISGFSNYFIEDYKKINNKKELSIGSKFMFPLPEKGSACKRMNLFLRWMVRKDDLDFGLWKEIPPNKLVIPVDTHVARISRSLRLTKRKNVSWKMAEEITEKLKKFDSEDPVKYDFAICHIGIRKIKF